MRTIRWLLINGIFAVCLYYGLYLGNEGAENVALFYAWISFIFSLIFLSDDAVKKMSETAQKSAIPRWLDVSFDIAALSVIVYTGWFVTGIAYLLHITFVQGSYDKIYDDK